MCRMRIGSDTMVCTSRFWAAAVPLLRRLFGFIFVGNADEAAQRSQLIRTDVSSIMRREAVAADMLGGCFRAAARFSASILPMC